MTVPMPPTGEAAENPYAAGRFAEAGRTRTRDASAVPDRDAVIVLSAWHWDLTETRRYALERWVESGGRLVVAGHRWRWERVRALVGRGPASIGRRRARRLDSASHARK